LMEMEAMAETDTTVAILHSPVNVLHKMSVDTNIALSLNSSWCKI